MNPATKAVIWAQFGAAIDMLENAIRACPESLWGDRSRRPAFWYMSFHTLFFLDFYSSESSDLFQPPAPFTRDELDPRGILPERPYLKDELLSYLDHGRKKCRDVTLSMTDEQAAERRRFGWGEVTRFELLCYGMRHVQHHAAQLNLMLREATDAAPTWVARTGDIS